MSVKVPEQLSSARSVIVEQVVSYASDRPAAEVRALRDRIERALDEAGPAALSTLLDRIAGTGSDWSYYAPDPLSRRIHHVVADVAMTKDSELVHRDRLFSVRERPLVFVANHLSYSDANLLEILLVRAGLSDVADRLTVIVGPKVYSDSLRRFSSLCFGTIKTPQSSARSSAEAIMPVRDVARVARETIAAAQERQRAGDALLVFVEGTRSRTGTMQRTLPAVARYFEHPGAVVVPLGLEGSDTFVPIGEERVHPARVVIEVGHPAEAKDLDEATEGNRRVMMDAVGVAIARLLPPEKRGAYSEGESELAEASRIADLVFGSAV